MYLNGTILTIAVRDAEVAENLLSENEQQVNAEKRPAKNLLVPGAISGPRLLNPILGLQPLSLAPIVVTKIMYGPTASVSVQEDRKQISS